MYAGHNLEDPVRVKIVEETSGYTLSNIRYIVDSTVLHSSFLM